MRKSLPLLALLLLSGVAAAQEYTLRLHHFLTETSRVHQGYIVPWAERVMEASGNRIRIEIYPNMQLGGSPASLIDQVRDGVVDIVWTLPGYTPGRFPITEVFELPFMSGRAEHSSGALCEFYFEYLQDEYREVRVITLHTAGPGVLHLKGPPVTEPAELRGKRVRAPSRITAEALALLGADPIGMPVPEVPESLARGVIDGALLPWEVTAPLRIAELVDSHTLFGTAHGFYTSTFLMAMNETSYARLPADLQAVLDANSIHGGCEEARLAGANNDAADLIGLDIATARGNEIHEVPEAEVETWLDALAPLEGEWIDLMDARGLDGEGMLRRARELVNEYETAQ